MANLLHCIYCYASRHINYFAFYHFLVFLVKIVFLHAASVSDWVLIVDLLLLYSLMDCSSINHLQCIDIFSCLII